MKQIDVNFVNKFWDKMITFERGIDEEYMQDADVRPEVLTPRDRFVRKVAHRIKFSSPFYRFMIKGEMYTGTAPYLIMFSYLRSDKIDVHFISAQAGTNIILTLSRNECMQISYEEISKQRFCEIQDIYLGTEEERFNNNYKTVQQIHAPHMDEIQSHPLTKLIYERLDVELNRDKLQGVADLIVASGIYGEDGQINSNYVKSKKKKDIAQLVLPENIPSGNAWFYFDDVCKSLVKQNYINFNEGL